MQQLYPPIKPYQEHHIVVGDNHILYVEECGNSKGLPVLFVHGGPGAGCTVDDRCFFDPEVYRIILFDQRGCGRSTPHGSLESNTTMHLIEDIEKIRLTLKVARWVLFGGSWGSTLSLLYAQAYPQYVISMILRGIFLCREQEINWFYQEGASRFFPDYWQTFLDLIPYNERNNMVKAYHKRLNSEDEIMKMAAAKHWSQWEAQCATLQPCPSLIERFTNAHTALSLARIENHYFSHNTFIKDNQVLDNMSRLDNIPSIIVHGRYDMICPIENAFDLQKKWPKSELHIIRDAGHSTKEPGIALALLKATYLMAQRYAQK